MSHVLQLFKCFLAIYGCVPCFDNLKRFILPQLSTHWRMDHLTLIHICTCCFFLQFAEYLEFNQSIFVNITFDPFNRCLIVFSISTYSVWNFFKCDKARDSLDRSIFKRFSHPNWCCTRIFFQLRYFFHPHSIEPEFCRATRFVKRHIRITFLCHRNEDRASEIASNFLFRKCVQQNKFSNRQQSQWIPEKFCDYFAQMFWINWFIIRYSVDFNVSG